MSGESYNQPFDQPCDPLSKGCSLCRHQDHAAGTAPPVGGRSPSLHTGRCQGDLQATQAASGKVNRGALPEFGSTTYYIHWTRSWTWLRVDTFFGSVTDSTQHHQHPTEPRRKQKAQELRLQCRWIFRGDRAVTSCFSGILISILQEPSSALNRKKRCWETIWEHCWKHVGTNGLRQQLHELLNGGQHELGVGECWKSKCRTLIAVGQPPVPAETATGTIPASGNGTASLGWLFGSLWWKKKKYNWAGSFDPWAMSYGNKEWLKSKPKNYLYEHRRSWLSHCLF